MKRFRLLILLLALGVAYLSFNYCRWIWYPVYLKVSGKYTLEEVHQKYGVSALKRLESDFYGSSPKSVPEYWQF